MGFASAYAVWEDMRKTATSYAGVTWERCEDVGLQWPCPTLKHPGTQYLYRGGKFARGKGLFHKTEHVPPAEQPDKEYPLVLSTGRRLWHYHTGTQTRRCAGLTAIFPEELLEMNPENAEALGIKSGDLVLAKSRRGEIKLRAWISGRAGRGMCWTTFHFAEACGNALTNDAFDPITETPEYKACAILVEKLEDGKVLGSGIERQGRP
jgi:formate dehydrogenase major subunit